MNNILQNIISLFSDIQINENDITEEYSEVKIDVSCTNGKCPKKEDFDNVFAILNSRDNLHLSILQGNEIVQNYDTTNNGNFNNFINDCSSCLKSGNFQLIATITKNISEQKISVYYSNRFFDCLSKKSINHFLEIIKNVLNGNDFIVFEVQDNFFNEFHTQTIKFVSKGRQVTNNSINRAEKINKIKNLCHCNIISKYQFTPDDFYPTNKNNTALDTIFSRVSLLYSAFFLFDIFNVNGSNVDYKLNGYKTISKKINSSDIDISSHENYYQIYSWVYEGGNIVDKIGLTRNILSLNLNKDNLKLSETTFEAIRSGYKIYQKENIKQYIEIRNKISDQLIELQNKADKIVENFVSDFKKSFLAVVSFFISVIVIKVVSSGDFTTGFTKEVTLLTIGFLLISLFVMFFARWEINKQIIRHEEFYKNLKARYTDLLDPSDINRILNNDTDFNCNKKFIENKKEKYTILWVISLIMLFAITVLLFVLNNQDCSLIKSIICFIKNI
jgi:hypothetical protein